MRLAELLLTKPGKGGGQELHQPNGARIGYCVGVKIALNFYHGQDKGRLHVKFLSSCTNER